MKAKSGIPEQSPSILEEQKVLFAEKIGQLFRNAPFALLAQVVNSIALVVIQRDVTSREVLITWLTSVLLISLLQYIHIRRFRRESQMDFVEVSRWGKEFIVGLGISGGVWGSAALLLFPTESLAHQTFLAFVIGGMVAGAAAAFSIFHRAFLAVSVPALIPLIVRFALLGDELHNSMSAMVILFGVMIFFIARQGNAIMVTSLKLRFENRDLVSRLTARKANADKLNRDLLSEINERDRLGNELRNSERRLRHLSSELLMAQEKERRAIAAELHDSLASDLAAIKWSMEQKLLAGKKKGERDIQEEGWLEDLITKVKNTIADVRGIMTNLRPSILDDLGIMATISWFTREFEKTYGHIRVESQIGTKEEEIPPILKTVIFRVLQEAASNIAKHNGGDRMVIVLRRNDDQIQFSVKDNGHGFDILGKLSVKGERVGLGLTSMQERVEISRGKFIVDSTPEKGTVIQAEWPALTSE